MWRHIIIGTYRTNLNFHTSATSTYNLITYTEIETNSWFQKRSRHTLRDIDLLLKQYNRILLQYLSTQNVTEACRQSGVARVNFYRNRYISELRIVDPRVFGVLLRDSTNYRTSLLAFSNLCKLKLTESPFRDIAIRMKGQGKLMPWTFKLSMQLSDFHWLVFYQILFKLYSDESYEVWNRNSSIINLSN